MRASTKRMASALFVLLIISSMFFLKSLFAETVPADELWHKNYGGVNDDAAKCLIQTFDGGFALAGYTQSFGLGGKDFWLVKTDGDGNMKWNETFGGAGDDVANCLVQTSDGGFAIAGTSDFPKILNQTLLIRTDVNGSVIWSKTFNEGNARSMIQTSDGGFVIAGYIQGSFVGGWLAKVDSSGNMKWSEIVGGGFSSINSLVQTSDGGFAMAGDKLNFTAWKEESLLVKTNGDGNITWSKQYGGLDNVNALNLIHTVDEGFVLTGELNVETGNSSMRNLWVVKTDVSGNMLWNKVLYENSAIPTQLGGGEFYCPITQTYDGGLALAGGTDFDNDSLLECWLAKTDANGNEIWSKAYRDQGSGRFSWFAASVVQTSDLAFVMAGITTSGNGGLDFCLIRTNPDSNVLPLTPKPSPSLSPSPTLTQTPLPTLTPTQLSLSTPMPSFSPAQTASEQPSLRLWLSQPIVLATILAAVIFVLVVVFLRRNEKKSIPTGSTHGNDWMFFKNLSLERRSRRQNLV